MNLYSHAVLANHVLPLVHPAAPAAYLWGAVAPDIRYLAGMPRKQTHLPLEQVAAWSERFPDWASFIQGYHGHCLLDQVDTAQAICKPFPLRLVRPLLLKKVHQRQAAVAIELYYHRAQPLGLALEGSHNPVLAMLGVTPDQSEAFAAALRGYLAAPSFHSAATAFTRLGILQLPPVRIGGYGNPPWG